MRPSPSLPKTLTKQALALHQAGRIREATSIYQRILQGDPDNHDVIGLLGTAACQLGELETGVHHLGRALELAPDQPKVRLNRGAALLKLGRFEEALACYEGALATAPDLAEAHYGRGNALQGLGRPEEALAGYDRALAARPVYAEAANNRANILRELGRLEEARTGYEKALAFRPDHVEAHHNLGNVLRALGRVPQALASYRRAAALRPDFADAHCNIATTQLLLGDYAAGWKGYEWRWGTRENGPARPLREPLWLGEEELRGRTLLIHPEQGLGDCLQFCRYALLARDRGAQVVLEAPRPLAELLRSLGPGITVVPEGDPLPPFDLHCPLMSLPLAFGTGLESVPAPVPYLAADPARTAGWQEALGPRTRPRIGLFWAGNQQNKARLDRSVPLAELAPVLDLPLDFHALQKEMAPSDAETLQAFPQLKVHPEAAMDFPGTAALIEALDLVVTVDSSIAHLAGALGKPTWILLPQVPDYRWMLQRRDTPWYPAATLFRQPARGDWRSVVREVAAGLEGAYGSVFQ